MELVYRMVVVLRRCEEVRRSVHVGAWMWSAWLRRVVGCLACVRSSSHENNVNGEIL